MLSASFPNKLFKSWFSHSIPLQKQQRFLRRLSLLIGRGYSLVSALEVLQYDTQQEVLVISIKEGLLSGESLDQVLSKHGFSKYVISYLYFSKAYGNLQHALDQSADLLEKQQDFMIKGKKALQYPAVLLFIMLTLLTFVKTHLLPSFINLFSSMNINESDLLHTVRWMDRFLYGFIFLIITLILCIVIWKITSRNISLQNRLKIYQNIPICKTFLQKQTTFLFAFHMSSLLSIGLPIQKCLLIIKAQNHFPILSWYAQSLYKGLSEGQRFHTLISNQVLFEKNLSTIIQRNQYDGNLELDLNIYAQWMMEEIQSIIHKILNWVQPSLFLFLGVLIMVIYASIMMPLFQWMNQM
ncbi:competence type IV pilus assembly protein ComGB [Pontibacillus yanchengensis]|uniref:Type II secretion system protein GspF domain-containing protein n=1 Tax=Pontibacillus yanchengensis Y32 TaxID=1385514 RepID=A0A0A2TFV5_9BACI|nr:competence type IV pilus assembly protein ComGB [Pontibacillus yanchengensis]KGP72981.1 hypothetical protein N782_08555 [Pontibacillus yanchengensis Y32]